jgi:hypothetical protein
MSTFIKRFYHYQNERFPIVLLALSLLPAVLSSGAVITSKPGFFSMCLALVAALAFLLHIRIIDEERDFEHDAVHHPTRPLHTGRISQIELHNVDSLCLLIIVAAAAFVGYLSLFAAMVMLGYSYLAQKEFFLGEKMRRHFFAYNAVNLTQMLFMQIFIYTMFGSPYPLTLLIALHFIFTSLGTLIFEFLRKLKLPGGDGTGRDTYTWHLGFDTAVTVYQTLLVLNMAIFLYIISVISAHLTVLILSAIGLSLLAVVASAYHTIQKSKKTDQLMQLAFLLAYGLCNLVIYFIRIGA